EDFIFRGSGFGHGLGLCQEGAHVAARRGMGYRQILNHYFPGTRMTRVVTEGRQAVQYGERERPEPRSIDLLIEAQVAHAPRTVPMSLASAIFNRLPKNLVGIQKSSLSSEHFRATYPAKADRRSIENMLHTFEAARADLIRRLEAASLRLAEPGP